MEYILLLAVVMSLLSGVYNSATFQSFLGEDSDFFKALKRKIEFAYRHGYENNEDDNVGAFEKHQSFYDKDRNQSRFFSTQEGYPRD